MAHTWTVPGDAEGRRLDRWLAEQLPELSRSRIQALIHEGYVQLDGQAIKPSTKLASGGKLSMAIPPDPVETIEPESMDLEIIHEDDHIVVVNKPAGLVVHPAVGHTRGTLVHGLLHGRALATGSDPSRPGIAHRLDKDTSGVLVVAKSEQAYGSLVDQFRTRTVGKTYLALVHGAFVETEGRIEAPIGRHPRHPQAQSIRDVGGKDALTDFDVLGTFEDRTLLAVYPKTGRTHQIRVHFMAIGHPVVGDVLYGRRDDAAGLMLHAWQLELDHPSTGGRMAFTAPPPPRFRSVVAAVEGISTPRPRSASE